DSLAVSSSARSWRLRLGPPRRVCGTVVWAPAGAVGARWPRFELRLLLGAGSCRGACPPQRLRAGCAPWHRLRTERWLRRAAVLAGSRPPACVERMELPPWAVFYLPSSSSSVGCLCLLGLLLAGPAPREPLKGLACAVVKETPDASEDRALEHQRRDQLLQRD